MKKILLLLLAFIGYNSFAQYNFTDVVDIEKSSIKSQDRTGTCWSFATVSFLESEIIRMHNKKIDLSEMYNVSLIYEDKAKNYVLRQGKANFSQGSLAHDVLRAVEAKGLMLESAFNGKPYGVESFDHSELVAGLKGFLDGVIKNGEPTNFWLPAFNSIVANYLGNYPDKFTYEGKSYTPEAFANHLGIKASNYVHLSSFSHHPFYKKFILEVPDNYSNGSFYNLPLDEFVQNVEEALRNGYSLAWDGDVSEKGFSAREGIAVLPKTKRDDLFTLPGEELEVNQEERQANFLKYSTTDDHLMHVVGMAKDQNGTKYFIIKNSWGEIGPYQGYLYMSEAYFKMKTVSVSVHKDALMKSTKKAIGL